MRLTHLSLFSGIGGFDLAASWCGFETVAMVENNPWCRRVLEKNFPGVPIYGDVNTFHATEFRGVSLVTGGFPCQDISAAGQGAGIVDGKRSALWFEMLRVVRECRPLFVLAENVPALRTKGADRVLYGLEEAGYTAEPFVVGAGSAGAPHIRKRVFIVGIDAHCIHARPWNRRAGSQDNQEWLCAKDESRREHELTRAHSSVAPLGVASYGEMRGRHEESAACEPIRRAGTIGAGASPYLPWGVCEPPVPGVVARVPRSVDRIGGLGNAVVPAHAYPFLRVIANHLRSAELPTGENSQIVTPTSLLVSTLSPSASREENKVEGVVG